MRPDMRARSAPCTIPISLGPGTAARGRVVRTLESALDEERLDDARNGTHDRVPPAAGYDRRRRAVVADHDPTTLWLLRRALADDFDLVAAENGQHAVELVRATRPDIVLLDLDLLSLDDFGVCGQIRAAFPHMPIVILSGGADEAAVRDVFMAGATDYVSKPFMPSQLRARLHACLLRVE